MAYCKSCVWCDVISKEKLTGRCLDEEMHRIYLNGINRSVCSRYVGGQSKQGKEIKKTLKAKRNEGFNNL